MPPPPSRAAATPSRWAAALIVVAVFAAYANSFSVPFVFDDQLAIVENPTLRQLWPPWAAFSPPRGQGLTVEGRPLLNFTLALNQAVSGVAPWSYHLANTTLHALAALALFGLARRTLVPLKRDAANSIALGVALLWAVHPLQTESVTYVVQRTESMMGLLFLATLYFFRRGTDATQPASTRRWFTLAVVSSLLGMATKEVMVTAPLVVLLYDRTFVAGSWGEAWRRHWKIHSSLAATWMLLGFLVIGSGNRGGTIGAAAGVTWWQYAFCQSRAVVHYARLAVWPSPLIFDYGSDFVSFGEIAPYAALDIVLLAMTGFALWRRPALGFVGVWYFLILAPTSSVVGGTRQMLAEHRIYLSLAALIVLAVVGLHAWLGRRAVFVCALLGGALIAATAIRNHDYRSELALYTDIVAKRPANVHARYNLGKILAETGRLDEAIVQDEAAVRLNPDLVSARYNLANALSDKGRFADAVAHYEAALRVKPDYAKAHFNLGNALVRLNRKPEAAAHYWAALQTQPAYLEARDNLGSVLLELGQLAEAEEQLQQVLRINPNLAETRFNLGTALFLGGNLPAAAAEYERVLQLNPRFTPAHEALARIRAARP